MRVNSDNNNVTVDRIELVLGRLRTFISFRCQNDVDKNVGKTRNDTGLWPMSGGEKKEKCDIPSVSRGRDSFLDFVVSSIRADRSSPIDETRARFPFPRAIKAMEKNPLGGRGLDEDKESLSIRALAIFTFPERTCHVHTHARVPVRLHTRVCMCVRARARERVLFSRAQVDAHARSRWTRVGRKREKEMWSRAGAGAGREVVASSKRDAMGRGGRAGNAAGRGRAPRVGKFRSRLDILALTTCIGRAAHAPRTHRRRCTVLVAACALARRARKRLARNCRNRAAESA